MYHKIVATIVSAPGGADGAGPAETVARFPCAAIVFSALNTAVIPTRRVRPWPMGGPQCPMGIFGAIFSDHAEALVEARDWA